MCYNNSMSETIIIALITGFVTLLGNLIANYSVRKKDTIENATREQHIEDKLQNLTNKVNEHNLMLDRINNIEKAIIRIETKMEGK